jgi:Zn-dependent protease
MLLFIGFGWAKPVPVNVNNLDDPRSALIKISIAGPLSNLILALIAGIILRIMLESPDFLVGFRIEIIMALVYFLVINSVLCVFNMLPIYPLDGSKVLAGILPQEYLPQISKIMYYTRFILIGIIVISFAMRYMGERGILSYVFEPFIYFFTRLMTLHYLYPSNASEDFFSVLFTG